jgi:putative ABC transport system permease protein
VAVIQLASRNLREFRSVVTIASIAVAIACIVILCAITTANLNQHLIKGVLIAASLAFAGLSVTTTIFGTVSNQTHEIGVMRALGAKRISILSIFLAESAIFGAIGSVIGVIVGLLILAMLASIAQGSITVNLVVEAFSLGIGVSIVAGFYPAWKASNISVAEALRYEH